VRLTTRSISADGDAVEPATTSSLIRHSTQRKLPSAAKPRPI
jgi:hypothetical protein